MTSTEDSIFRLIYEPGSLDTAHPLLMTLMRNEIIVKTGISRELVPFNDTTRLTKNERFDFDILQRFYPFDDTIRYIRRLKGYLDSLSSINPRLTQSTYYEYLLNKSSGPFPTYQYRIDRVSISPEQFARLSNLLRASGYWNLPYDLKCPAMPTDAGGFSLEGKNGKEFQFVMATDCPGDTSLFRKACFEVVKIAGLENRVPVIWYE